MDHNDDDNGGRDWSSLPSDVLATIADHLRIRAVCKSWAHSVPKLSMPSPLLLLPGHTDDSLTFCSFASMKTTFQLPAPPRITGTHCVGSHDGWLAMCGPTLEIFIFNPFTGERIDLPPLTTLPGFELFYETAEYAVFDDFRCLCGGAVRRVERCRCYVRKVVFSSSPTAEDFVALALDVLGKVVYCRAGEERWDEFGVDCEKYGMGFCDVLFHDGRFWALNESGMLYAFDLRGRGSPAVSVAFKGYDSWDEFCRAAGLGADSVALGDKYMAVGNGGNIVTMIRVGSDLRRDENPRKRRVIMMEFVGPEFNRDRVIKNLGGHSLFIGNNNGFFLPVEELPLMGGNCVFVIKHCCTRDHEVYDIGVLDMEKESELMVPQCTEYNWCQPLPIWFKPSMKLTMGRREVEVGSATIRQVEVEDGEDERTRRSGIWQVHVHLPDSG